MAKKSFTSGIDNLITSTMPTKREELQREQKNTKTSLILPENLYLDFKIKYLVPQKITLKDFIIDEMKKKIY